MIDCPWGSAYLIQLVLSFDSFLTAGIVVRNAGDAGTVKAKVEYNGEFGSNLDLYRLLAIAYLSTYHSWT